MRNVTFGVEIELVLCLETDSPHVCKARRILDGILVDPFGFGLPHLKSIINDGFVVKRITDTNEDYSKWIITQDSSLFNPLRGKKVGYEIISPKLVGDEGINELVAKATMIAKLNVETDNQTGLHVHMCCKLYTTEELKFIIIGFLHYEEQFDELISAERRKDYSSTSRSLLQSVANHYGDKTFLELLEILLPLSLCDLKKVVNPQLTSIKHSCRYHKMNLSHIFDSEPHIEYRLHEGTTDPLEIKNWVLLLDCFMEITSRGVSYPPDLLKEVGGSVEIHFNEKRQKIPLPRKSSGMDRLTITLQDRMRNSLPG